MIKTLHRWQQSGKRAMTIVRDVLVSVCADLGRVGL